MDGKCTCALAPAHIKETIHKAHREPEAFNLLNLQETNLKMLSLKIWHIYIYMYTVFRNDCWPFCLSFHFDSFNR